MAMPYNLALWILHHPTLSLMRIKFIIFFNIINRKGHKSKNSVCKDFYVGVKYLFVCEKELLCIESIKISFISIKLVINVISKLRWINRGILFLFIPVGIYLLKVNNRNTRTRC